MKALIMQLHKVKLQAKELFRKIDVSGDGSLDAEELRAGLVDIGVGL